MPFTQIVRLGGWTVTDGATQATQLKVKGMGIVTVDGELFPTQLALLKIAVLSCVGEAEVTVPLYAELSTSGSTDNDVLVLSAAGLVDTEELNRQRPSESSQPPFMSIPVISVGEASVPWKAKI